MDGKIEFSRQDIRHFLASYGSAHPDDILTIGTLW